jgi:hypothetical protein
VTLGLQRQTLSCETAKALGRRRECYSFCKLLAQRSVCSILATVAKNAAVPGQFAPTSSRLEATGCHMGGQERDA